MSLTKKMGFGITCLLMLAGLAAYTYQYKEGLVVTNMRNSYTWGLYVFGLAFFVGNAAGGLVLSSMIYLFGVTSLKPFAKIGALAAFANVTAAMLSILPDIGQPVRLYHMILNPQLKSPLVWDVIILNVYALISLVYLYLLMMPDLTGRWKRYTLKVNNPREFSEKWAKRLAPFSLVAAVGIHVVTAWIFATQGARDWWNSAVLAPDFVAVALASGTAIVLVASLMAYGYREEHRDAYRQMSVFMAAAFFIHLFLMYNDFLIHAWYGADEALSVLSITFKDYGAAHAFEVIAPLLAVILLLSQKVRRSAVGMVSCCSLLIVGVFTHRFLIMPAAFDRVPLTIAPLGLQHVHWSAPIASGQYAPGLDTFVTAWRYFPSLVEVLVFAGVMAYMGFIMILAVDRLPVTDKVKT